MKLASVYHLSYIFSRRFKIVYFKTAGRPRPCLDNFYKLRSPERRLPQNKWLCFNYSKYILCDILQKGSQNPPASQQCRSALIRQNQLCCITGGFMSFFKGFMQNVFRILEACLLSLCRFHHLDLILSQSSVTRKQYNVLSSFLPFLVYSTGPS